MSPVAQKLASKLEEWEPEVSRLVESLVAEIIELATGLAYATNPGNLRLELSDLGEGAPSKPARTGPTKETYTEPELVIES